MKSKSEDARAFKKLVRMLSKNSVDVRKVIGVPTSVCLCGNDDCQTLKQWILAH